MRNFLFTVVLLLILVTSVQLWITQDRTSQKKEMDQSFGQGEAQIGGAFTLTDQTGKLVHNSDFHGHITLVYFGFTQCPDVCPVTLMLLTKAMGLLGDKADQVIPLFISVDSEHDSPAVMQNYITSFDKRMVGLTGTPEQVRQAQEAYKVYAAKKESADKEAGDNSFDHSSYIYVMGKDGKFLAVLPSTATETEVSQTVERYLNQ